LTKMPDISTRIRFLACEQIEAALSGIFPSAEALPFGSSVNGFGKNSSDLDVAAVFNPDECVPADSDDEFGDARLIFHAKGASRNQTERYYDHLSLLLHSFMPGCQNVQSIRQARVPIIKYEQQLLGLECDLSTVSSSGVHMSDMLHVYGELDERVRPLASVVRK